MSRRGSEQSLRGELECKRECERREGIREMRENWRRQRDSQRVA